MRLVLPIHCFSRRNLDSSIISTVKNGGRRKKMIYMIDLHGVIDANPKLFKKMTEDLTKSGNDVYICAGSKRIEAEKKLDKLGFKKNINYIFLISISDILSSSLPAAEIEYDVNGNIWVDDMLWWPMKGKLCKIYNIDVIIDDSEEYFVYVPKNVIKLHYHETKN